ncbi:MAG: M23 family metallopeptidase [Lachnospira sp.]|nr:M23 family metallopeptidase [Lachnospira sp.]
MTRITRYGRRIRRMLVSSMTAACFACLFAVPFAERKIHQENVGCYSITYNGTTIGTVNTLAEAEKAVAEARRQVSKEFEEVVYLDATIDIVKEDKVFTERMSQEDIKNSVFDALMASAVDKQDSTAYTVRIDDFTVTLSSKEEIVELMQKVTSKYDTNNAFQVVLKEGADSYGEYSIDMVRSTINDKQNDIVSSPIEGDTVVEEEQNSTSSDGITGIGFGEKISISETLKSNSTILTVDEAYEAITKEKAEKTMYTVVEGDTLSAIARKCEISLKDLFAMNTNLKETSIIVPGDEIVVTVPKAELSVVLTMRKTYEESYDAEIKYVDNNKAYRGTNTVINNGSKGYREVTADITYVNGVQSEVKVLTQKVIKEATPKVVSVGTLTPPRYLRPVSGGNVTYSFGYKSSGAYHTGVDWGVGIGTPVKAAASGRVTMAGWYGNSGYTVEITHSDGTKTRYKHLSRGVVSVGQYVSQSQLIAYSGNTGYTTGAHLHFEIIIGGRYVNPLNYVNKY